MAWEGRERLRPASSLLKITGKGKKMRPRAFMFVCVPGADARE